MAETHGTKISKKSAGKKQMETVGGAARYPQKLSEKKKRRNPLKKGNSTIPQMAA